MNSPPVSLVPQHQQGVGAEDREIVRLVGNAPYDDGEATPGFRLRPRFCSLRRRT